MWIQEKKISPLGHPKVLKPGMSKFVQVPGVCRPTILAFFLLRYLIQGSSVGFCLFFVGSVCFLFHQATLSTFTDAL